MNTKPTRGLIALLLAVLASSSNCKAHPASSDQQPRAVREAGTVNAIRSMNTRRAAHTATLLPNGEVLIAGGMTDSASGLASAESFDPTTNTFTAIENMAVARTGHTATLLQNGKVLIAGGYNGDYLDSAELFDPATGKFTLAGKMVTKRSGHIATLLNSGKVLLAGGTGVGWTFLSDAELYDPTTNIFTRTGNMTTARESHTATLLKDGMVLITGGHRDRRPNITIYSSTEIYNPVRGTFAAAGDLTVKRHKHDASRLADGRVLIVGGADERDGQGAYRTAEIFDPASGSFTAVKGQMSAARYKLQGTTIVLQSGKVLIAGGSNRAEVFDPATDSFSTALGDMGTERLFSTATRLNNGQVLITGGYHSATMVTANAWIYRA